MNFSKFFDSHRCWIVAISCSLINFFLDGLVRSAGILFVATQNTFQVNRQVASLPFVLCTALRNLSGPIVGLLAEKFGVGSVTLIGGLASSIGIGLCYFASSITWMTISWGGLFGIGYGLGNILLPVIINNNFDEHISKASGISFSGSCIGSFAFPSLLEFLLYTYNLQGTFLLISGLTLHTIALAMVITYRSSVEAVLSDPCQTLNTKQQKNLFFAGSNLLTLQTNDDCSPQPNVHNRLHLDCQKQTINTANQKYCMDDLERSSSHNDSEVFCDTMSTISESGEIGYEITDVQVETLEISSMVVVTHYSEDSNCKGSEVGSNGTKIGRLPPRTKELICSDVNSVNWVTKSHPNDLQVGKKTNTSQEKQCLVVELDNLKLSHGDTHTSNCTSESGNDEIISNGTHASTEILFKEAKLTAKVPLNNYKVNITPPLNIIAEFNKHKLDNALKPSDNNSSDDPICSEINSDYFQEHDPNCGKVLSPTKSRNSSNFLERASNRENSCDVELATPSTFTESHANDPEVPLDDILICTAIRSNDQTYEEISLNAHSDPKKWQNSASIQLTNTDTNNFSTNDTQLTLNAINLRAEDNVSSLLKNQEKKNSDNISKHKNERDTASIRKFHKFKEHTLDKPSPKKFQNLTSGAKLLPVPQIKVKVIEYTYTLGSDILMPSEADEKMSRKKRMRRPHANSVSHSCYENGSFSMEERVSHETIANKHHKYYEPSPNMFCVIEDEDLKRDSNKYGVKKHTKLTLLKSNISKNKSLLSLKIFANPLFLLVTSIMTIYEFIFICMVTVIVDFSRDIGVLEIQQKWLIMVFSIGDIFGRLCMGWITDRKILERNVFTAVCFLCTSAAVIGVCFSTNLLHLAIFFGVFGIFESGAVIMFPLLMNQYIESESLMMAIASSNFLPGIVTLIIPLVIGAFRDCAGSYTGLFHVIAGISAISALFCFSLPWVAKKQ